MATLMPRSLKRLLILHESAFVVLVLVTGGLGGLSAYYWQQSSLEAIRLNVLMHQTQQIRGDMYRQLKEVTRARLTEDPSALNEYASYSSRVDEGFARLARTAGDAEEGLAIDYMRQAYAVVHDDINQVFTDPNEINEAARMKLLVPAYEEWMLADFESAVRVFSEILAQRGQNLETALARWTVLARLLIPCALLLAMLLVIVSRRTLRRGFLDPIHDLTRGARELSRGRLDHHLEEGGVDEIAQLAVSMNHMARELAASRDALLENERQAALGALVPVVAHNIRNPLASIRATAQLIEDRADAPGLRDIRIGVIESVDRLERWVSALLSYLHPLKPYPRPVRMHTVVDGAVKPLETKLKAKSIEVVRENWELDCEFAADPDLLEQALHGLLNNAIDASPEGASIVLRLSRDRDSIGLTIDDQGPGIPFEPNPRDLTPLPSTKRFGTGLGIPFAFKVCQTHGGRVSVTRRPEGGTRAALHLPLSTHLAGWTP
jgi:signal transduction histidine kinase